MEGHEAPPGYTVTRRLGSDASGMHLATEGATGRPVTLRFVDAADPSLRERLVAAVPALRAIEHPHVITFIDVVEGPSGPVVVLGPADGGSLAGILGARGVLPPGEVVTACAPVADGLTELHRRGLVHGDVTLDDIVFTLDGRPMIAGAGLVQAGAAIRAGQYARPLPPEVQAGSLPGAAADVYGLAAAAVVALTGYLPPARLALPGVAPAAEALLVDALNPHPQRRPSAADLGNAFFAIADPAPVELVLDEGQSTTGSLPPVEARPTEPDDDIAAYMRRSTSTGRRARRRADADAAHAAGEQPGTEEVRPSPPGSEDPARPARRGRRSARAQRGDEAPGDQTRVDRRAAAPVEAPAERGAAPPTDPGRARRARPGPDTGEAPKDRRRVGKVDGVWIVSAVVAVLILAGAAIVGMQLLGGDELRSGPGTGSSPSDSEASTDLCGGQQPAPTVAPPAVADWTQEVQRLYSLRAQAFEESDAELLCQVHAPTNPVLAEDAALLQEYADAGVHTEGLAFEVVNAELVSQEGGRVTVDITQRIPDYQLVNEDGEVEQEIEGTPDETWQAELVAVAEEDGTASSWRFG